MNREATFQLVRKTAETLSIRPRSHRIADYEALKQNAPRFESSSEYERWVDVAAEYVCV